MKTLSVVIPTDGRYETLKYTIAIVLSLKSVAQIIVLDSSGRSPSPDIQKTINDQPRVRYIKTNSKFNAVENFNEGIPQISSEYCIYIGDDDILTESIDEIMENWNDTSIEALVTTFPTSYQWPGYRTKVQGEKLSATVVSSEYTGNIRLIENPKIRLKEVAMESHLGPQDLPRIYLGIVRTSLLKCIHSEYSGIFGGVSPDIYSSTLLAWNIKKYAIIDYPIIVPGAAPKSTSASSAADKHTGRFEESRHLQAFRNLDWPQDIPKFYSVETVWAYSMKAALIKANTGLGINTKNLYNSFKLHEIFLLKLLFTCVIKNTKRIDIAFVAVMCAVIRQIAVKIKQNLSDIGYIKPSPKLLVIKGMQDSFAAKDYIEQTCSVRIEIEKIAA
jgi:glycosyltransferase involved in cell wall biosynthesis